MNIFHVGKAMKSTPSAFSMAGVGRSSGPNTPSTTFP